MHFQIEWAVARGVKNFSLKVTEPWPQRHVGILVNGLTFLDVEEPIES
jgi:hypothetical protein